MVEDCEYIETLFDRWYEGDFRLFYTLFPLWENCKLNNPDWYKSARLYDYINYRAIEEVREDASNGLSIVNKDASRTEFAQALYDMAQEGLRDNGIC